MVLERTLGLSKVPSEVCSTLDLIVLKNISAGGGCRTGWPSVLEVGGDDETPDARRPSNIILGLLLCRIAAAMGNWELDL